MSLMSGDCWHYLKALQTISPRVPRKVVAKGSWAENIWEDHCNVLKLKLFQSFSIFQIFPNGFPFVQTSNHVTAKILQHSNGPHSAGQSPLASTWPQRSQAANRRRPLFSNYFKKNVSPFHRFTLAKQDLGPGDFTSLICKCFPHDRIHLLAQLQWLEPNKSVLGSTPPRHLMEYGSRPARAFVGWRGGLSFLKLKAYDVLLLMEVPLLLLAIKYSQCTACQTSSTIDQSTFSKKADKGKNLHRFWALARTSTSLTYMRTFILALTSVQVHCRCCFALSSA